MDKVKMILTIAISIAFIATAIINLATSASPPVNDVKVYISAQQASKKPLVESIASEVSHSPDAHNWRLTVVIINSLVSSYYDLIYYSHLRKS